MSNTISSDFSRVKVNIDQGTISNLLNWAEGFMLDRRSRGIADGTISFYRKKLTKFVGYFTQHGINTVDDITANHLREFFVWLENEGHNRGGVIAFYKAVRAFLKWYKEENGLSTSSIERVKISTKHCEPLEPVDIEDVKRMIEKCNKRDKAIILMLLDTGLRASELVALTMNNVNPITGIIRVVDGKGGKSRTVYIGRKTRQALRKYLDIKPESDYLFTDRYGEPITYWGLRQIIRRRAKDAKVETPTLHSFRRYFALSMLRNEVDIYSLQLLMGHADLQVLRRYLKQTRQDTLNAHLKGCPVDHL